MGNCLTQQTHNSLINIDINEHKINSTALSNSIYNLEIWHNEIKDALMIMSGYSFNYDHTIILDCIISYILFSTPIFIDNKCEYNPKKSQFEFRFHDQSNNILNIHSPKYSIDLKLNTSERINNSFNVFVSRSGYVFITGIIIGWVNISQNSVTHDQIVIYSKIYENIHNKIYIQSPWNVYTKHYVCVERAFTEEQKIDSNNINETWSFQQFLVSDCWGLIQCLDNPYTAYTDHRENKFCIIIQQMRGNIRLNFKVILLLR
eukprot:482387_1